MLERTKRILNPMLPPLSVFNSEDEKYTIVDVIRRCRECETPSYILFLLDKILFERLNFIFEISQNYVDGINLMEIFYKTLSLKTDQENIHEDLKAYVKVILDNEYMDRVDSLKGHLINIGEKPYNFEYFKLICEHLHIITYHSLNYSC